MNKMSGKILLKENIYFAEEYISTVYLYYYIHLFNNQCDMETINIQLNDH